MRVLLCIDGYGTAELIQRARALLDLRQSELLLLHVADTGPRSALELARGAIIGAPPLPPDRARELTAAERARATAVIAEAEAQLGASGLRGEALLVSGVPERQIVALAGQRQADLVVLFAHRFGRAAPPGPRSVGHTARFVLDHAPCPVLLLR